MRDDQKKPDKKCRSVMTLRTKRRENKKGRSNGFVRLRLVATESHAARLVSNDDVKTETVLPHTHTHTAGVTDLPLHAFLLKRTQMRQGGRLCSLLRTTLKLPLHSARAPFPESSARSVAPVHSSTKATIRRRRFLYHPSSPTLGCGQSGKSGKDKNCKAPEWTLSDKRASCSTVL